MAQEDMAGSYPALWFLPSDVPATPLRIAQGIGTLPNFSSWVANEAEYLPFVSWEILEAIAQRLPQRAGSLEGLEHWSIWTPILRCAGDGFGAILSEWAFRVYGSVGEAATACSQWRSAATLWLKTTPGAGESGLARFLALAVRNGRHAVAAAQTLGVARDIPTDLLLEIAPSLSIDICLPFLLRPKATVEVWLAWARSRWGSGYLPQPLAYAVACRPDLRREPELRAKVLDSAGRLLKDLSPLKHLYATAEGQAFWVEVCARSARKTYIPDGSANDADEVVFHLEAQAMLDEAMSHPASTESLWWLCQSDSAEIRKWAQLVYLPCVER